MTVAFIDVRDEQQFLQGHIKGSASLALEELEMRMHELPSRHLPIHIICDQSNKAQAIDRFTEKQYKIADVHVWGDDQIEQWISEGLLEKGPHSARLWQPAPVIQQFVDLVDDIEPGTGLDIACGCGREAVFLALHGWQMTGIDYQQNALDKAQRLARHHQVDVQTRLMDIEADIRAIQSLPKVDLICVQRYLHRPLLPLLEEQLNPGGFLIYQTFMQGCEKYGRPKNPNFLLAPDELRKTYASLDVLFDEVIKLEDERPTNAFIARKAP